MRENFSDYIETWHDELTGETVTTVNDFSGLMMLPVSHVAETWGNLEVSGDHIARWRDHEGPVNVAMSRLAAQDKRARA